MLKNKIALITGGSRGIGKAIALEFAKEGASIVLNYTDAEGEAIETQRELKALGAEVVLYPCDVSKFDQVDEMIATVVKKLGRIDILVNNAGITRDGLLMKMSEADYDAVLNVNLKGTFNTIRFASRQMMKQKSGRIINLSSVSGVLGNAGQANYAASKAGVIGLTKTTARELASRGITCNAIAPGFIDTDMTRALPESVRDSVVTQIPLKEFGQVEDIANMVTYLASEKGKYITGQVLHIDGGMAM